MSSLACGLREPPIGEGLDRRDFVSQHGEVKAVGMRGCVPLEDFDQSPRFDSRQHNGERRHRCFCSLDHARGMSLIQCAKEVADGLRRAGVRPGKPHAEGPFDP